MPLFFGWPSSPTLGDKVTWAPSRQRWWPPGVKHRRRQWSCHRGCRDTYKPCVSLSPKHGHVQNSPWGSVLLSHRQSGGRECSDSQGSSCLPNQTLVKPFMSWGFCANLEGTVPLLISELNKEKDMLCFDRPILQILTPVIKTKPTVFLQGV